MKAKLLLLVSILVVVSLSCALIDAAQRVQEIAEDSEELQREVEELVEGELATEESTADESEAEESSQEPASDEGPVIAEDALQGLDSYQSKMSFQMVTDEGVQEQMIFEVRATRDPAAQHIIIQGLDDSETMEMVQIEGQQWLRFGDSWMQTQAEDPETFMDEGLFLSPEDVADFADDEDYEFVGKERVNGLQTRHYRLNMTTMDTLFAQAYLEDVDEVSIDVWVSDEANLPAFAVRFLMDAKGEVDDEGTKGTFTVEQEITAVNTNIVIEPPAEAATGGLPEDIPLHPDAQELTSMAGMTIFSVDRRLEDVTTFYNEQLSAAGWTEDEASGFSSDEVVMQSWTKDNRTLQVNVSAEDDGGVGVMLMLEQPED